MILESLLIKFDSFIDTVSSSTKVHFFGGRPYKFTTDALYMWKKHVKVCAKVDHMMIASEDIENFFPSMSRQLVNEALKYVGVSKWARVNLLNQQRVMMRGEGFGL